MRTRSFALFLAGLITAHPLLSAAPALALPFEVPHLRGQVTGSSVGAPPQLHDGAPVPEPFGPEYLVGYISDRSSHGLGLYYQVARQSDRLRAEYPEVMEQNLATTIAVNNAAAEDPELVARAQFDAAADSAGVMYAVSDALGPEFGAAFRAALEEKRLPKTEFLLGNGYAARAGGLASSTWIEKEIFGYDRPFVVAPDSIIRFELPGHDFYGTTKSFPSGHTNQATWVTTLLGLMLPEVGPELLARGAESGYHRMVMGVHYPLDVIGGRMSGTAAAADRSNDPRMREALQLAGEELRTELEWRTGRSLSEQNTGHVRAAAVERYTRSLTYGLPRLGDDAPVHVPVAAPDLLLAHHPYLTWEQRAEVLRQTALPAGYPLDDPEESWQRLNLAAAWAAEVTVGHGGGVTVLG